MALTAFTAVATTREIAPGRESMTDGKVRVRERLFTDVVESNDERVAGENKPLLDLDIDPAAGSGTVSGPFTLTPKNGSGTWVGRLTGELAGGMVVASGLARGTGSFEGRTMRIDFQQIPAHPSTSPVDEPKAFFRMSGYILDP
jgi:hypothetical protein